MRRIAASLAQPLRFTLNIGISAVLIVALAIAFLFYVAAEKRIDQANHLRQVSFLLSEELRNSSDELSRAVRAYVVTGNPVFKRMHQEILDVRRGTMARPAGYDSARYWDLARYGSRDDSRDASRPALSLMDLMRRHGFTQAELDKVADVEALSDKLATTESEAMSWVERQGPGAEARNARARELLFGERYYQTMAVIMRKIDEFFTLMDYRTNQMVLAAERSATALRFVLIAIGMALTLTLLHAYSILRNVMGGSVEQVQKFIVRISKGEFTSELPAQGHWKTGVLAWLVELQKKLGQIERERRRTEAELLAAKESAENADRLKSQFLDIAAHELRTPVTAFSALLQLSERKLRKGEPVDLPTLARLRGQADRISQLVVDLLDVSRLERGLVTLRLAPTDIGFLVADCVEEVKLQIPGRRIGFWIAESPTEIEVDPLRIRQVLVNLLDNAIKYTPEDTPIELKVDSAPEKVRISVIDHGGGISQSQQTTLFQAFSRGRTEQEEKTGGLGLGLYICQKIMELHGGRIGVMSEVGRGSTFFMDIPRIPRKDEK